MNRNEDIPESVMEEAVGWLGGLDVTDGVSTNVSKQERQAFIAWLLRSPTHIEAFLSVSAMNAGLSKAIKKDDAWLDDVLADVEDTVVPLSDVRPEPQQVVISKDNVWNVVRTGIRSRTVSMVASILVVVGLGLIGNWWLDNLNSFTTAQGEQRSVVLEDGSVVQLNTNSAIKVQFSGALREITLMQGEAIFDVQKDPDRPFRVTSNEIVVEAIGTRFNVYQQVSQTVVTVVEGSVAVERWVEDASRHIMDRVTTVVDNSSGEAEQSAPDQMVVQLAAGEQLALLQNGAIAETTPANIERTTAWTQRRLMFDEDTIAEVASEFNRYNHSRLVINDPTLRKRRVSGIFNANDPEAFVAFLNSMIEVRIVERPDGTQEILSLAFARATTQQ